jgi:hypothetical protein
MSDLSPEARRLLDDATHADDPTPGDQERVARALAVPLGIAALAPTAAQAATVASTSFVATGLFKGAVVAAALIGASAGAVWHVKQRAPHAPTAVTARSARVVARPAVPVTAVVRETPSAPAPAPVMVPAPVAVPPRVEPERSVARAHRDAPSTVESLRAESQLLGEASCAMNDGDAARALRLLEAYRGRFPHGVLREEHAVASVLALCRAGRRAEARATGERFLRAHPHSPLAARVERACADE